MTNAEQGRVDFPVLAGIFIKPTLLLRNVALHVSIPTSIIRASRSCPSPNVPRSSTMGLTNALKLGSLKRRRGFATTVSPSNSITWGVRRDNQANSAERCEFPPENRTTNLSGIKFSRPLSSRRFSWLERSALCCHRFESKGTTHLQACVEFVLRRLEHNQLGWIHARDL